MTGSPTFLWMMNPTAWSTLSDFLARPAPKVTDGPGMNLSNVTAARRCDHLDPLGAGESFGLFNVTDIATLGANHLTEFFKGRAIRNYFLGHLAACSQAVGFLPEQEHVRREMQAMFHKIGGAAAFQGFDRLDNFERVANCSAEGLVHIGNQRGDFAPGQVSDGGHGLGQLAGRVEGGHKSAVAGFYIQHNGLRPGGQFFAHDG